MRAFDLSEIANFPWIPSVIILWDLKLYDCAVIDVNFRIDFFDKKEPSSSVLVYQMYFLLSTQNAETKFHVF